MGRFEKLAVALAVLLAVLGMLAAGGYAWYLRAPAPPMPKLSGAIAPGSVEHDGRQRTYLLYVPANLKPGAALVFAMHGSMGTAEQMRVATGYGFERLADKEGFAVVYPQGYKNHWHDCRKATSFETRHLKIDDVGFLRAVIARLARENGIDTKRVYAMGGSNGGHMAYRLALEAPDAFPAVAASAANLPTDGNSDCNQTKRPVSVLILNGTADPINPYNGGDVTLFGFGNRGSVRSADDSARYFARLIGAPADPVITRVTPGEDAHHAWTESATWAGSGGREVMLYVLHGAGHVLPQPWWRYPRLLGYTPAKPDATAEMWRFFQRHGLER